MEIFKVNSAELIEGAGEDVFSALNAPESNNIFSLQRFADVKLRQSSGESNATTTLISQDSISGVLSAFTLGRSSDQSITNATATALSSSSFVVSPMVDRSGTTIYSSSYKLAAYQVNSTETRIAIQFSDGSGVPNHVNNGGTVGAWTGIAYESGTGITFGNEGADATFTFQDYSSTAYSTVYTPNTYDVVYSSTYFNAAGNYAGRIYPAAAMSSTMTYSLDLYDVKVGGSSTIIANADVGKYFYRDTDGKSIDFLASTPIIFDGLGSTENGSETETYVINGISTTLISTAGNSTTNTFSLTAAAYATSSDTAQTFSAITGLNSNTSIAFNMLGIGSDVGLSLNGQTYKSDSQSGTVKFSVESGMKVITLGDSGTFTLNATDGTIYNLESGASGTFGVAANKTFILDLDGAGTAFNPMSFTTVDAATVTAIYSNTGITLAGKFGNITGSGTEIYNLAYTFSDEAVANIGAYAFSDTKNSSDSLVTFANTSGTSIVLGGPMSVGLTDTAATAAFENGTMFTLSTTGTYQLNGQSFYAAGNGDSKTNLVTFISTGLTYAEAHSGTSYMDLVSSSVTGFSLGDSITMQGAATVKLGSAMQFGDIYVGASSAEVNVEIGTDSSMSFNVSGGGTAQISGIDGDGKLAGVSNTTLSISAGGNYEIYLRDNSSDAKIVVGESSLTFDETSNGTVSKLLISGTSADSISVYGDVVLKAGTDVAVNYTLTDYSGATSGTSAITINGLKFAGSDVTVSNAANKYEYTLGLTNGTTYAITGTTGSNTQTFKMAETNGMLEFGSTHISTSGTKLTQELTLSIGSNTTLASNTKGAEISIAPDKTYNLNISDATGSEVYTVYLNEDGSVSTIGDIDSGATLTAVAGATYVLTTEGSSTGIYTFNSSSLRNGSGTQIFDISGDTDGVQFIIDSEGTVQEITGITGSVKVYITDTTVNSSTTIEKGQNYFEKSYTAGSNTFTRDADNGTWGNDNYVGYIVDRGASSYSITGLESGTFSHAVADIGEVGASSTNAFTVFSNTITTDVSVAFQNTNGTAYAVSLSDTSSTSLFTNLGATGAEMGVLASLDSDTNEYKLAIRQGLSSGDFASSTAKSDISTNVSLTLGAVPLTVYDGYVVSGTGVAVTANSENVTVTGASGATAYISMEETDTDATVFFGNTTDRTYLVNDAHLLTLKRGGSGNQYTVIGSNTAEVFSLTVAGGNSYVEDTISSSDIAINGITYGIAEEGKTATIRVTTANNASDTALISGGVVAVDGTDVNVFANTNIVFAAGTDAGLVFDVATYTASGAATYSLGEVSDTQYATVANGTIQAAFESDVAVLFNGDLYTTTSVFEFTRTTGSDSDIMVSGSAKGASKDGESYTINVLNGDVYALDSGSGKVITFSSDAAAYDTYHMYDVTYEGATGEYEVAGGSDFSIADAFMSGTTLADFSSDTSPVYKYTATTEGSLYLDLATDATITITASDSALVGTRTTSDTSTVFTLSPVEAGTETFTYAISEGTTATFAFNSDVTEAAGAIWEATGTRAFAAGDEASFTSDATIFGTYNSDVYTPDAGATMTLVVKSGVGTETFTSGSATYAAAAGDVFHFAMGEDINAYTATAAVELGAYFNEGTGKLYSATGEGTRQGSGEYAVEALGDTYAMGTDSTIQLTLNGTTEGTETFTAGTGVFTDTTFHISDEYLGLGGTDTDVYTYNATTANLTLTLDGTETTINLGTTVGSRSVTDTGVEFSFTLNEESNTYTSTAALEYRIDSDAKVAAGDLYAGAGLRTLTADGTANDTATLLEDVYTAAAGATMTLVVDAGLGTETFTAGSATYAAAADSGTFHFTLDGVTNVYSATGEGATLQAYFNNATDGTLYAATGTGARYGSDTMVVLGDTYSMNSDSTIQLTLNGTTEGTETLIAGTGTYNGDTFHVSDKYLGLSENEDSYEYTGSGVELTLNLKEGDTDPTIELGATTGTRVDSDTEVFSINNATYTALSDLTFQISSSSTSAAGDIYAGTGSRTLVGEATANDTRTYLEDVYTAADGAIMTIEVKDGEGTETFTSGSATYAAAADDVFHFALDGNVNAYTATTQGATLQAYFSGEDGDTGVLVSATGEGTRTGSGDYVIEELEQTYTMAEGSIIQLSLDGTTSGTETFVGGTGTSAVDTDAIFKVTANILGDGVESGGDLGDILVYSATSAGELTLTLDSGTQKVALTDGLEGIRNDTEATTFTFAEREYTVTDSNSTVFKITADNATTTSALGDIYSGVGTRTADEGEEILSEIQPTFNNDTYTATNGVIELKLTDGESTTSLISGEAAYTASETEIFHFGANEYTALEDGASLTISVDYQASEGEDTATLLTATGKGVRTITEESTFAVDALGGNEYTFANGTAQIELNVTDGDTTSYVETAYSGEGTYAAASGDSATVQFDATNSATGTVYSYVAGDDGATFAITMEDGNVTTQSITAGSATREGTEEDTTFQFQYNGEYQTYSTTSVAESTEQGDLTFILNAENQAVAGAAGTLYQGVGYRNATGGEEIVSPYSNTYTLSTSDEYRLTVADGEVVGDGEELFHVDASNTYAVGETFNFDGTQYTVQEDVTLNLTIENAGTASETGSAGIGLFETEDTNTTFSYAGNLYNVAEGGATLSVDFGQGQEVNFEAGAGVRELSNGDSYNYTDSNTYVMESEGEAYIEVDEDGNVVQNLNSGTGTATFTAGQEFAYTLDDTQNTYTAEDGATLTIVGQSIEDGGATVSFTNGTANRTADGEGETFTYESNTYTAVGEVKFTLSVEDGAATENITAGSGTRTASTFSYTSLFDSTVHNYTAEDGDVTLTITLDETGGTETLTEGAGTRALESGTTFNYTTSALGTEDVFTTSEDGTLRLSVIDEDSGLLAMGYNTDAVTETIVNATAVTTKDSAFSYTSLVTSEIAEYTPADGGVQFQLNITDGEESVTWLSGSATMLLESGAEFAYTAGNAEEEKTYTAADGTTFTRISEDTEYMSAGTATREVSEGDTASVTYLEQAFVASSGTMVLSVADGDTVANETFDAGEAVFTAAEGDEFNYALTDGTSHTYTATAEVTLTVGVEGGAATELTDAEGAGTRAFGEEEATETVLFDADTYAISEGVYGITLGDIENTVEELVSATGTFTAESGNEFHVNDAVLGGEGEDVYAYTAGDEGVTLNLTISDGSNTVAIESGLGTRESEDETFDYGGQTYEVSSGSVVYAISAESQTAAAGFLYNAVGTREGEDSTTFVFQEDEYTAENGTFRLTVVEGDAGDGEQLIAGTATYTAETDAIFHYNYEEQGLKAYTATAVTSLEAVFEMDEEGEPQVVESSINGSGLRYAEDGEEFSTTYQEDTYNAVAGSTTILLDATDSENIFETIGGGQVAQEVSADGTFHYSPDEGSNWYEYTAQNDVTITLDLDNNNTMSFSDDPNATRTTDGEDFEFGGRTYSADGGETTYLLTGSETTLTEEVYAASGSRSVDEGEEYTSALENVYTLSEGTYNIMVSEGEGTETLTAGAGTAEIAAGDTFNYGENVQYTANAEGATLGLTISEDSETELLTAGAGFDGTDKYIAVDGAKVTLAGTAGSTLNAVAEDEDELVTLTADETSGLTAVENSGNFTAEFDQNGTLKVNSKDFVALEAGTLGMTSGLDSFDASGAFSAEGDFTDNAPALSGGTVDVDADTDVVVFFGADGVSSIGKLSDEAEVNAAAGAAKAVTDEEGTFNFNNDAEQKFEVTGDSEVTFQLDSDGVVTGIAGINQGATFNITDSGEEYPITVDELGKVLTRNEDGSWASADVVAEKYLVNVMSDNTLVVSAIDSQGDLTQIAESVVGSVIEDTLGNKTLYVNDGIVEETKALIVTNSSPEVTINLAGAVTVGSLGLADTGAAIQVDTDTTTAGAFKTGSLSGNDFVDSGNPYTVMGGAYFVGTEGNLTVVSATDGGNVNINKVGGELVIGAENVADVFTVNDGPAVTLQIGEDDTDSIGFYSVTLDSTANTVSALTPSGVQTGTVVVPTGADEVKFAIGSAEVTVSSDDGNMTLEIKDDALYGLSDIATNATISASGVENLAINGDSDNVVAVTSDPIKYNSTDEKWLTGDADAKDATSYLVSVTADGTVELYFTDADHTELKQTKNKADYVKVFGEDVAPESDGAELPNYSGSLTILDAISDTAVSVAAGNEGVAVNMETANVVRDLVLITADGVYSVNNQEIIPSDEVTVSALSTDKAHVSISSDVTVAHGSMTFTAENAANATFSDEEIILTDSAKVANTDAEQSFFVLGSVTFDEIAVVTDSLIGASISNVNATIAPSGLKVNDKELNVMGGDVAYTVNVAGDIPTIIGINGESTVQGELAENAEIQTASTGSFVIANSAFTIANDEAVTFETSDSSVNAIYELTGTATGNFSNGVKVDDGEVLVTGDETIAVTADGTIVTAIDGVGADDAVTIAKAGGATLVNTDKNGEFIFGATDSYINSQRYVVKDEDEQVSFTTAQLAEFTPSVTAVSGLNNGTIAIGQDENGIVVDGTTLTLGSVGNDVTISAVNSEIAEVEGLEGSINGLTSDTLVQVVDSNATINGQTIAINEGASGTTVVATAADTGYSYVSGLNKDAIVNIAANVTIATEEEGAFTFPNGTFTISGDSKVTFITDAQSKVADIQDFSGTLQMTASEATVNGAPVALAMGDTDSAVSDVTIASSGSGVDSIIGLGSGDSVTAPAGTDVVMPGSSDTDTATTLTVNGKEYELAGDTDTVVITPGATVDSISGLNAGASLTFKNTAGTYNVNGTPITAGVGSKVIGDEEGTAHIYDPSDVDITENDSTSDVVNKLTGSNEVTDEERYVESLDSDAAEALASEIASGNLSNANGNIKMTLANSDTSTAQTTDFSNTTGIKKVTMEGEGEQNITFNNQGGNIAIVDDAATGAKNVKLGNGGDVAVIGNTSAPVNVTAGKGADSIVTQGRHTTVDLSAGGATRLMANGLGANMEVSSYDHTTGAGIQLTNNNIKEAVKKNTVHLENGAVTTNSGRGATIRTNEASEEGASVVNFYNLKGVMTKVGYTHNEGGTVDLSDEKSDVVLKGNYQQNGAQKKSGSSVLRSGSGNDYALGGAGDDIDVGEGDNTVELDGSTRSNADAGATITQSATRGKTEVTGFNNEYGNTGDRLNIAQNASVRFVNGVLTFIYGAAQMILSGMSSYGGSSSDLAESADEDDNATSVEGTTEFAPILIGDVKTAVASEGNWIGGDSLWTEENMPTAYVGSGSGVDLRNYDGAVNMTLTGAGESNSEGTFGGQGVSFRGISKLRLGNGESTVYGSSEVNNTIVAGLGASSVWGGGASDDTFIGRQTSLKSGADTFFYVNGDGKDVISNFEFLTSDNANTADIVNVIDAKVTGASVSGQDVLVNLTNDNDRLTIKDAVGKDFQMEYGAVGSFETLTAQVGYDALNYDDRATYYQAVNKNATVNAGSDLSSGAEIWLNNNRDFSDKTFVGDIKVLNASGVEGRSTLVGNSNDNVIYGSSENSSMWGGDKGGNDTLVGGAGADMFWYGKNNGNDTITSVDGNDVINLYDVNIADVESYDSWNITNNAVSFNMKDSVGGGSLTIMTNNSGVGFKFADDGNTYAINQRDGSYYIK